MIFITNVSGREIFDSRGTPTIEAQVELSNGSSGRASVPSGASTGAHEAIELRDCDPLRFSGQGVIKPVANLHDYISPALKGQSPFHQPTIDHILIELDGTIDKSRLGANAILAASLAVAHAAAAAKKIPLYQHLSQGDGITLPVPMFNIINGGVHAENSIDIQEFMVIPAGLSTFKDALRAGVEIYQALRTLLHDRGLSTNVGDEGGFAPSISSTRSALDLVLTSIEKAGYTAGKDCYIGIDVAASGLASEGRYIFRNDGITLDSMKLADFYDGWSREFHLLSIEDGLAEEDWAGWQSLAQRLGNRVQLVGDDLYATNVNRIQKGISLEASNAVLLKLNQIGTLTETIQAFSLARQHGWGTIVSHRSGETEDTSIADLSVALDARQIKAGAPCRSERVAKYNRLLRIEEELGSNAKYAGLDAYKHLTD